MATNPTTGPAPEPSHVGRYTFAALSASLIGAGLVRFVYTPLLPALIDHHWFSPSAAIYLSAANLSGYLLGAVVARPLGRRLSNVSIIRFMEVVAVCSLFACAFPLSLAWYFAWRLISGIAGGTIVVLVAATVLPHVPINRRGIASGVVFLGIGLGIAASGTIVPVLLGVGLRETWLGLAVASALLTVASWRAWPSPTPSKTPTPSTFNHIPELHPHLGIVYLEMGLMALAPVPTMLFIVGFAVQGLGLTAHTGALVWIAYGIGSLAGPLAYGLMVDRFSATSAIRTIFAVQCAALSWLAIAHNFASVVVIALITGTFVSGVVPLNLAWLRELLPGAVDKQNQVWSRATIVFAASQAAAGFAYSALLGTNGYDYREPFLLSALAIALALLLNFMAPREGLAQTVVVTK